MDELKKLLAEATPGPWYVGHNNFGDAQGPMSVWPDPNMIGAVIAQCGPHQSWEGWFQQAANDAALIAAAVNALPELLERVTRLEAIETAARTYFNGYMQDEAADDGPEMTGCGMDQHVKAAALRAALKETGQ